MALRDVLKFPDKRLQEISTPIEKITDEIRELASDMGETIRLIVVDTEWTADEAEQSPLVLVNPKIVENSGKIVWKEGCLSVPDFEADVERASHVVLHASNLEGEDLEIAASELQAVCFQHEIDHLDGILFIDRISRLKRNLYTQRRKKQLRRELEEQSGS